MSMFLDALLASAGNEAFDDQAVPVVADVVTAPVVDPVSAPEVVVAPVVAAPVVEPVVEPVITPDPVDVAAVNAAAVLVAEAEADLEIANSRVALATLDGELAAAEREVSDTTDAINHIQEVSAGIEHFMEVGSISASTAMLLQQSVNSAMRKLGKDGRETMAGGLEQFGDSPDQAMIVLGAGLLELEEEKKSLATKVMNAIKAIVKTIGGFIDQMFGATTQMRTKVTGLQKTIKGKPEKEVEIRVGELMISKEYSTNIPADLDKFKVAMITNTIAAITSRSNWYFKTAPQWINKIAAAGDADEALGYVKKLVVPPMKNATTSVRDEEGMVLKRTEVTLGNYAVFELSVKAGAPTDAASAVAYLKATAKSRINIQRAKIGIAPPEPITMNEALASKILSSVDSLLAEVASLKPAIDALVKQSIDFKAITSEDADVKKMAKEAANLPMGLVDTVSQLPRTVARAALDVSKSAVDLVEAFAKAKKADAAEKDGDADAEAVPA